MGTVLWMEGARGWRVCFSFTSRIPPFDVFDHALDLSLHHSLPLWYAPLHCLFSQVSAHYSDVLPLLGMRQPLEPLPSHTPNPTMCLNFPPWTIGFSTSPSTSSTRTTIVILVTHHTHQTSVTTLDTAATVTPLVSRLPRSLVRVWGHVSTITQQ